MRSKHLKKQQTIRLALILVGLFMMVMLMLYFLTGGKESQPLPHFKTTVSGSTESLPLQTLWSHQHQSALKEADEKIEALKKELEAQKEKNITSQKQFDDLRQADLEKIREDMKAFTEALSEKPNTQIREVAPDIAGLDILPVDRGFNV